MRMRFSRRIYRGSLLIKSIAVSGGVGAGAPDSENIRNGNGDYIIPGSSFKGAVRAQMEQILAYLKCSKLIEKDSDLIEEAFGKKGDDETVGVWEIYTFLIFQWEHRKTMI